MVKQICGFPKSNPLNSPPPRACLSVSCPPSDVRHVKCVDPPRVLLGRICTNARPRRTDLGTGQLVDTAGAKQNKTERHQFDI